MGKASLALVKNLSPKSYEQVSKIVILDPNDVFGLNTSGTLTPEQPFFEKAKNGNKILIFTNAKLVILYDQYIHKIINVGPLNVVDQPAQISPPTQAKIILRNGSKMKGLTYEAEKRLHEMFPDIDIEKKEQAANLAYNKTLVIVLNPLAQNAAEALAKFYSVTISELPAQEDKPKDMDILIILGEDQTVEGTAAAN